MRNIIELIRIMPREEWILGIMMVTVFPVLFWAIWVMIPA